MVRTGYLRWEIDAADRQCPHDRMAGEVSFLARPTYRRVRVKATNALTRAAAENFRDGTGTYQEYLAALQNQWEVVEHLVPDVGPHVFRYSQSDRDRTPGFWITKVRQEARAFAHQVVRDASAMPELVVSSPGLRLGYARLVEWEMLRAIEGRSRAEPTNEAEPIFIETAGIAAEGIPELVAAELVRDVLEPKEFAEFSTHNRVTVRSGGKIYRISRRTQALIEVWTDDGRPLAKLCVVFRDPGMPPSDEVVMKYLLARHEPEMLWKVGNRFPAPAKPFDGVLARR